MDREWWHDSIHFSRENVVMDKDDNMEKRRYRQSRQGEKKQKERSFGAARRQSSYPTGRPLAATDEQRTIQQTLQILGVSQLKLPENSGAFPIED